MNLVTRSTAIATVLLLAFAAQTFGDSGAPTAVGAGELLLKSEHGLVPLPVVRVEVDLSVTGIMVRARMTEEFTNPTGEVVDAVYVFPLPERASVDAMEMTIGERRIVSVVQEREEARATYEKAKQEGKKASLLSQERPNLFTTSVANINPGETVLVKLEVLEEISYVDDEYSIAFPLTFTPRYAPASSSDLPPEGRTAGGFVPGHHPTAPRATLRVRIDAGVPLESIRSSSHPIHVGNDGRTAVVEPDENPVLADRDFLLRWRPHREEQAESTLFVEDREDGRYALLMLLPPAPESHDGQGLPTDTLFVVDVSGSMDGPSIAEAREALLAALDRLRPGDTFNLLKFNDQNEPFRHGLAPAEESTIEEAREWVHGLRASGGTEILPALVRALEMMKAQDTGGARRIVLVTDGAVANEEEAFREVAGRLGTVRLHVLGIGAAPNRYLMRKLAFYGRGSCEFLATVEEGKSRMDAFLARLDRPVLTDVSLDWEGAPAVETYPERLPDLYAGEALFFSLKLGLAHPGTKAVLSGAAKGGRLVTDLTVNDGAPKGSGIANRWARAKVEALVDSLNEGADAAEVRRQVVDVAKEFHLVTRYTSLVAVEEVPTAEGPARTARVASCLPQGSTLLPGMLPQGGTSGPLLALVGFLFTFAGGVLACMARR